MASPEKSKPTKKALLALRSEHSGFKLVNVGTANLVLLLYLDRIPIIHKIQLASSFPAGGRLRTYGVNSTVNVHVSNLHFVWDSAQGDYGPILKLKWREGTQMLFGPRQITHNETLVVPPVVLVLAQLAHIPQPLRHDSAGGRRHVNTNPLPPEVLRGN